MIVVVDKIVIGGGNSNASDPSAVGEWREEIRSCDGNRNKDNKIAGN